MGTLALLVRVEAKPGRESDVEALFSGALPIAQAEPGTQTWYAWKLGPSSYGIFDTFPDEDARQAHLNGDIAKALMANADELFSQPPSIEQLELMAEKLPA